MNAEQRDPIFESLDQLAGLADRDLTGDRMPDIRRRVRATRRRRVAGVGLAAAAVVAAGLGITQLANSSAPIDPAKPAGDLSQTVSIDAVPAYSDLIQIRVSVEGRSSAYTDAAGEAAPAGPQNYQIIVDGQVVEETKAADVTCEAGGEVSSYSVGYPKQQRRFVPATVPGPGEHIVEVRAPYCADGELIDEPTTQTVTTALGEQVIRDEQSADVGGDGQRDTVRIVTPAEGEQGDWELVVLLAGDTMISTLLPNDSEWSLQAPQDLDGDGKSEIIVTGGGGETWLGGVYQVDGTTLRLVPTLDEAGQEEPLAFGFSDSGPQNVSFQIELTDDGLVSFRYVDASPTRPAAVEVRRWVLADGTLTLQDATEPGCVDADFTLTLGNC